MSDEENTEGIRLPRCAHDVDARIAAAVNPLVTEMRWQRWILFVLVAATISPKLGGPPAPDVVAHLIEGVAQASGR